MTNGLDKLKARIEKQVHPNGFFRVINNNGDVEIHCPNCKQYKEPLALSKAEAKTNTEREQWISGICSDECWNKYLGVE